MKTPIGIINKAIFVIVLVIAVLSGAAVLHTQRAFAQVDCNTTPDDPSCQSSQPPSDNSQPPSDNNNPPADNSQPPQPSTQTCPDGLVIVRLVRCQHQQPVTTTSRV